jgi:polysaccharide pyruvyl transferase WcaK-like protein
MKDIFYYFKVIYNTIRYYIQVRQNQKESNIVIVGWYGTETIGDIGILAGILKILEYDGRKKYVVTLNKMISDSTKLTNFPTFEDVEVINIDEAAKILNDESDLIFGGGPLMSMHALLPIYSLWVVASVRKVSRIILGCGVGPLNDKFLTRYVFKLIEKSSAVILRDSDSRAALISQIGGASKIKVLSCPSSVYLAEQKLTNENQENYINFCLRAFPWKQYNHLKSETENLEIISNFECAIHLFIEELLTTTDLIIRPLPMCTHEYGGNDIIYMRSLMSFVPKERIDWGFCRTERALVDYCSAFMNSKLTIGMRYHSIVFPVELGANVIAIDYTEGRGKIRAFCDKHGKESIKYSDVTAQNLKNAYRKTLNLENSSKIIVPDVFDFRRAIRV